MARRPRGEVVLGLRRLVRGDSSLVTALVLHLGIGGAVLIVATATLAVIVRHVVGSERLPEWVIEASTDAILLSYTGLVTLGIGRIIANREGLGIGDAFFAMWRGDVPLGRTFWLWGNVVPLVLVIAWVVAAVFLDSCLGRGRIDEDFSLLLAAIVIVPYGIAVNVGIWRSAARYRGPAGLRTLARLAAGMSLLSTVRLLITGQ